MDGDLRRENLLKKIKEAKNPISGTALSKEFGVSRQIIVGDVALMRAAGIDIISTSSGYVFNQKNGANSVTVKVKHKTMDVFDVLCTVVDEGAFISSVSIEHSAYGKVTIPLNIANRSDAKRFSESMLESAERTVGELCGGIHHYNISSNDQLALIRIQKALNDKGYLLK